MSTTHNTKFQVIADFSRTYSGRVESWTVGSVERADRLADGFSRKGARVAIRTIVAE